MSLAQFIPRRLRHLLDIDHGTKAPGRALVATAGGHEYQEIASAAPLQTAIRQTWAMRGWHVAEVTAWDDFSGRANNSNVAGSVMQSGQTWVQEPAVGQARRSPIYQDWGGLGNSVQVDASFPLAALTHPITTRPTDVPSFRKFFVVTSGSIDPIPIYRNRDNFIHVKMISTVSIGIVAVVGGVETTLASANTLGFAAGTGWRPDALKTVEVLLEWQISGSNESAIITTWMNGVRGPIVALAPGNATYDAVFPFSGLRAGFINGTTQQQGATGYAFAARGPAV